MIKNFRTMPENEFEKNIQGRLDSLSLEPSPAVWQGVELRIRKDKRKRRWFIWLPLAAALGTGMWLWLGNGSDAVNRINESAKYPSQSSASANKEANNRETEKIEKDVQQESAGAEKNASSKKPQFVDQNNVDRLMEVEDSATDLNLIGGPVLGDRPTSIFRGLMRLT